MRHRILVGAVLLALALPYAAMGGLGFVSDDESSSDGVSSVLPTTQQYLAQASCADSTLDLDPSLTNVVYVDVPPAAQILSQHILLQWGQPVRERGVTSFIFDSEGQGYRISRVPKGPNGPYYRVLRNEWTTLPTSVRIDWSAHDQVEESNYISRAEMKAELGRFGLPFLKISWARFIPAQGSRRNVFLLFRDERLSPTNVQRHATGIVYARKYHIEPSIRLKLKDKHGMEVQDLDRIFDQWDGKHYPDFFMGRELPSTQGYAERRWFTAKYFNKRFLVVLDFLPDSAIPKVITAYAPSVEKMLIIDEFVRGYDR